MLIKMSNVNKKHIEKKNVLKEFFFTKYIKHLKKKLDKTLLWKWNNAFYARMYTMVCCIIALCENIKLPCVKTKNYLV